MSAFVRRIRETVHSLAIDSAQGLDQPLAQIVGDNWDRESAIAEFKAQQRMDEVARLARAGKWDEALASLNELETQISPTPEILIYKLQILTLAGRKNEVAEVRGEQIDAAWDNSIMLNQVAWETATEKARPSRTLSLR